MTVITSRPTAITVLAASLSVAVAGCGTAPSASEPPTVAPTQAKPTADKSPSFHGDTMAVAMPRSEAANGRSGVVAVSLFGETAAAPLDGPGGETNLSQVSFAAEGGDFTPDVDRASTFVVYASRQHSTRFDLYRKAIDGRTVTQLSSDPSDEMMPTISPDGTKIAFASNRTGNWDIFVMPTQGGPATQLTFDADDEVQPTWSPDGQRLAFARKNARNGRWEIWTAEGTTPSASTYLCEGFLPRWSPETKSDRLLFQRARQQGSRLYSIWTIDIVGGQASNPTEIVSAQDAAIIQPNWSPEGNRIVFTTVVDPELEVDDMPNRSDLWTVNLDGTDRRRLTAGPFRQMQPVWASDGKVYFVSNRGGVENLWAVATAGPDRASPNAPHGQPEPESGMTAPKSVAGATEPAAAEGH